jgi:hypothetical protein
VPTTDDGSKLSAEDVMLINELLVPKVQAVLRSEFQQLSNESIARDKAIEVRVQALEIRFNRVALSYGGIVVIITFVWHLMREWVRRKFNW